MDLKDFLQEKRSGIIKQWRKAVIETYPSETQNFLRKEKDQFANPVGLIIENEIERLYDFIVDGTGEDQIPLSLDKMIRVRAVQDFTPSDAVGFLFKLKDIIKIQSKKAGNITWPIEYVDGVFERIDKVVLLAFDIYMGCRQKINDLRVSEIKNEVGRVLEKARLIQRGPVQKQTF